MRILIEINGNNAAFFNEDEKVSCGEYVRILKHIATVLPLHLDEPQEVSLRDVNGNSCGHVKIEEGF
jgi:hypothetical protein